MVESSSARIIAKPGASDNWRVQAFLPARQMCYNANMASDDLYSHVELAPSDVAFLKELSGDLGLLADVSRSDVALFCRISANRAMVVAQAMPRSVTPVYEEDRRGQQIDLAGHTEIRRAFHGRLFGNVYTIVVRGATIARQVNAVRATDGAVMAVLVRDSYWLAHERQRRRSRVFQIALEDLVDMVLRGELRGARDLSPFRERDGIVFVQADRRIGYMSGVATSLYRQLGYRDSLEGRRVSELNTVDQQLVGQALADLICSQREDEQDGLTWIRRVVPITGPDLPGFMRVVNRYFGRSARRPIRALGALILIHDATEDLETQRELESKMSMIREVHHRVKNNLQVIASLMRMQARRVEAAEAREVLEESVNRILSVAIVHEFLSQNASGTINLHEVAHRILAQMQQGLIDPNKHIELSVKGADIWLPAERATQCALVVNELVQNAIEHGMAQQEQGHVDVELADHGEQVSILVSDDGSGLPEGFDLATSANLGLRIVRSLVERDLKGQLELQSGQGTRAIVRFDKSVLGGV